MMSKYQAKPSLIATLINKIFIYYAPWPNSALRLDKSLA